jgi:hypothetical protein
LNTKICSHCGKEKPVEEFYSHNSRESGLQPWCIECCRNRYIIPKSDLKPDEIKLLIEKYENLLRITDDKNLRYEYKYRIKGLKRDYSRLNSYELNYTNHKNNISTNIKLECKRILDYLGYKNSKDIYKEAEILSDKLCKDLKWEENHGVYSNKLMAVVIITEILDRYGINIDELKLLKQYDIPVYRFVRLSLNCHNYLSSTYWKKNR